MKIKKLVEGLNCVVKGSKEIDITGISSDSRTVCPGGLFIAKQGGSLDGTQFISDAINAGASAIATDIFNPFFKVVQLIGSPNEMEAKLASCYYGDPSKKLYVVGITGTKGKTSTSYLVKHLLDGLGILSGLIGTVETIIGDARRFYSTLTTHDVISNQKWLKEMLQNHCKGAVLEVSSHGLAQKRVDEIDFDVGVFTNLYPDHLDYHGTMDEYIFQKKKLFEKSKRGIFNADSPWKMGNGLTYGIEKGDIRAEKIAYHQHLTEFQIEGVPFQLPLIGQFNIYNALAAIAVGLDAGGKLEDLSEILARFESVPGRLQRIGNVFIDFAHTKEALENALSTLREIATEKVIVVFGSGGNRDPLRRIGMAKAAEKFADISIITNDNPRKEDPEKIANEIAESFKKRPHIELDRRKAIEKALQMAGSEDLILIAGRGHEKVQIFESQTIPFDDAEVVKEILKSLNCIS